MAKYCPTKQTSLPMLVFATTAVVASLCLPRATLAQNKSSATNDATNSVNNIDDSNNYSNIIAFDSDSSSITTAPSISRNKVPKPDGVLASNSNNEESADIVDKEFLDDESEYEQTTQNVTLKDNTFDDERDNSKRNVFNTLNSSPKSLLKSTSYTDSRHDWLTTPTKATNQLRKSERIVDLSSLRKKADESNEDTLHSLRQELQSLLEKKRELEAQSKLSNYANSIKPVWPKRELLPSKQQRSPASTRDRISLPSSQSISVRQLQSRPQQLPPPSFLPPLPHTQVEDLHPLNVNEQQTIVNNINELPSANYPLPYVNDVQQSQVNLKKLFYLPTQPFVQQQPQRRYNTGSVLTATNVRQSSAPLNPIVAYLVPTQVLDNQLTNFATNKPYGYIKHLPSASDNSLAYSRPQVKNQSNDHTSFNYYDDSLQTSNVNAKNLNYQKLSRASSPTSQEPVWSDSNQNQDDEYQQAPQTIQITAVPNGLGVGNWNGLNGLNGFNNLNGWNNLAGNWNNRQLLLVNRQQTAEWRQWIVPLAVLLALPLLLGGLFVPVFLKSVIFLIQILQMLGLLLPPQQLAGHLASQVHSTQGG